MPYEPFAKDREFSDNLTLGHLLIGNYIIWYLNVHYFQGSHEATESYRRRNPDKPYTLKFEGVDPSQEYSFHISTVINGKTISKKFETSKSNLEILIE